MAKTTLHMIGNAHIDPVWLWQWQEGFHEVQATFRSALDRMKEFPQFKFIASSAVFYQWVEENDPAMFAEIQQRVSEGRWGIVGGWWIEPDCNIPGGESFVRQGLYGQRFFKAHFGITAKVGYNIDSFGHHGMLPQILKKSGMPYYVFMRPDVHEKDLPGRVFKWEADDGSQVITLRLPSPYGTWGSVIEPHIQRCAAEIKEPLQEMVCFYGVGDHGGGPTIENINNILRLRQQPELPDLIFSTLDAFFADVETHNEALPTVHSDLQYHASGCYSAHSGIKRWVRQAENALLAAERWSSVAVQLTAHPYPQNLGLAWKNLLFNQFHDILAGTSLETAYADSRNQIGETMSIANRVLNSAVQSIAWHMDIPQPNGAYPVVVFNPNPWPCNLKVELEMGFVTMPTGDEVVYDPQGKTRPIQLVQSQATTPFRSRVVFNADLPGLGYSLYRIGAPADHQVFPALKASDSFIENDLIKLSINPQSGCMDSLFDKEFNLEVLAGPAARPVVIADPSDTWSHGISKFDQQIGQFNGVKVHLVENGPIKSVLRVESSYEKSTITQDFSLYADSKLVSVNVTVDWHQQQQMLKIRFPVNVRSFTAAYEIPYGQINRPTDGTEFPGQAWVDLSGSANGNGMTYGLSLLNDGKYSFDVEGNDIGLTVLRSPIYAHHTPAVPQPDRSYTYIDQGVQHFSYALLPHSGTWQTAGTVKAAAELNQSPIALAVTSHPGSLPVSSSFISIDAVNILATVIKKAEDSDNLVLRAYETNGQATLANIDLPAMHRSIAVKFAPFEIKTFVIPQTANLPVYETNLLEIAE